MKSRRFVAFKVRLYVRVSFRSQSVCAVGASAAEKPSAWCVERGSRIPVASPSVDPPRDLTAAGTGSADRPACARRQIAN